MLLFLYLLGNLQVPESWWICRYRVIFYCIIIIFSYACKGFSNEKNSHLHIMYLVDNCWCKFWRVCIQNNSALVHFNFCPYNIMFDYIFFFSQRTIYLLYNTLFCSFIVNKIFMVSWASFSVVKQIYLQHAATKLVDADTKAEELRPKIDEKKREIRTWMATNNVPPEYVKIRRSELVKHIDDEVDVKFISSVVADYLMAFIIHNTCMEKLKSVRSVFFLLLCF